MTLKQIFERLYPEGSWGWQCGSFAHKLYKADKYFPSLPMFIDGKKEVLAKSGYHASPYIGDVILLDVGKFGHIAVVNDVIDGKYQLTESNWSYDLRVTHTRQIPVDDPKIVGYWRGTPLFKRTLRAKIVQYGVPWASMAEKYQDINKRFLEASNGILDVHIDTEFITEKPPMESYGNGIGINREWYWKNIASRKGTYDVVISLSERTTNTFGWSLGGGRLQTFSNETDITHFPDLGDVNYFVKAFLHELSHHLFEGKIDPTHQYLDDSHLPNGLFDLKGLFKLL